MKEISLQYFMQLCIDLAAEKEGSAFLERTLQDARELTNADAGTLYIYENNLLYFGIMHNDSMGVHQGVDGKPIDLPPVPYKEENVCSYVAIHRKMVNIPDVGNSDKFDFSGPIKYDAMTGYHTKSMLVVPLINNSDEIIGVVQLINALDEKGAVVPFSESNHQSVFSLCSLAAVSLTNIRYTQEIQDLFQSFVRVLSTAIDERTPYNANHTKNVATYAGKLADYLNGLYEAGKSEYVFDRNRREQLVMSAWLHDIGKLVTPLKVINKSGRLSARWEVIDLRFRLIAARLENQLLRGELTQAEYALQMDELEDAKVFAISIDRIPYLDDAKVAKVHALAGKVYCNEAGEPEPWFTPKELESMAVRKGNLTAEERQVMEDHVAITSKLLSQIKFNHAYEHVPCWAGNHHEFLDGTGYPNHLTKAQLPLEVRILTALDIFDALTAKDRPYKPSMTRDKAIAILREMVEEGKLDGEIVERISEVDFK